MWVNLPHVVIVLLDRYLCFQLDYSSMVNDYRILTGTPFILFTAMSSYLLIIKTELPTAISEFLSGDYSG